MEWKIYLEKLDQKNLLELIMNSNKKKELLMVVV